MQEVHSLQLKIEAMTYQLLKLQQLQEASQTSGLLRYLIDAHNENCKKKEGGQRYVDDLKLVARHIFQLGGLRIYYFLKLNLQFSLPSITALKLVYASALSPEKGK